MGMSKKSSICINCLRPATSLYMAYSADVIRITECEKCGAAVDKYVEYDLVLILIDLMLQYRPAYRHIFFHSKFKSFKRVIFIFLLADAYRAWIERGNTAFIGQSSTHDSDDDQRVFDLEWRFYISLLRSSVEFATYALALFLFLKIYTKFKAKTIKYTAFDRGLTFFFESALIGFYGSLFVVFSIIWKLHGQPSYRFLTQLFIFITHLQIQRALFPEIGFVVNALAVLTGVASQLLAGAALQSMLNVINITHH